MNFFSFEMAVNQDGSSIAVIHAVSKAAGADAVGDIFRRQTGHHGIIIQKADDLSVSEQDVVKLRIPVDNGRNRGSGFNKLVDSPFDDFFGNGIPFLSQQVIAARKLFEFGVIMAQIMKNRIDGLRGAVQVIKNGMHLRDSLSACEESF